MVCLQVGKSQCILANKVRRYLQTRFVTDNVHLCNDDGEQWNTFAVVALWS